MNDTPTNPEQPSEQPRKIIPAKQNPWYLFKKECEEIDREANPNAEPLENGHKTWNRWVRRFLSDEEAKKCGIADLKPIEQAQLKQWEKRFKLELSAADAPKIDFSNLFFPSIIFADFSEYVFINASFNNARFERVNFDYTHFYKEINFASARFESETKFESSRFYCPAIFRATIFESETCFNNSHFDWGAEFQQSIFNQADFSRVQFKIEANFQQSKVTNKANFEYANAPCDIDFSNSEFRNVNFNHVSLGAVTFKQATFEEAIFREATFIKEAIFIEAKFKESALFTGAVFQEGVNFFDATLNRALFIDAEFKEKAYFSNTKFQTGTRFTNAKFYSPPSFHKAELHPDTIFHNTKFLNVAGDNPAESSNAWRTLKLHMNKVHNHKDELRFYGYELEAEAKAQGGLVGFGYWLYRITSHYGQDISLPFSWLVITTFFCGYIYMGVFGLPEMDAFQLSIANSIPFTAPNTAFLKEVYSGETPPGIWLHLLANVQSILSFILLFLLGLGLRNRFRIK